MAWVGRDLKVHSDATPFYGQGYHPAAQAAQGPIQPGLEYLQGWGIHSFSGQLCHCLTTVWVKNTPLWGLPRAFSSPGCMNPAASTCLHRRADHLSGLVLPWTCSNSSTAFFCWRPQGRIQHYRWSFMRAEREGRGGTITSLAIPATLVIEPAT